MAEFNPFKQDREIIPINPEIKRTESKQESIESDLSLATSPEIDTEDHQERARKHLSEVIESHKQAYPQVANNDDYTVPPKNSANFSSWLEDVAAEQRVEVAKKVILTKGKKMMDVIHAFIDIHDYQGLDALAEILSESYDELVALKIIPDLRRK